ncbi:MAG: 50S ribosomal protein L32 [Elusimicrobia bacterium]|nr:50S ribosomal protein L32 [Elusimicrobiota bacterium]
MPNPKRRHTRSRRDSRRASNWKLELGGLSVCPNKDCGRLKPPHSVCPHCGFYNGELIVARKEKKKKGEQPAGETGKGKT